MITLWGGSSAGKTALLAFLKLRANATERDWQIYPTKESEDSIERFRSKIDFENMFPVATQADTVTESLIKYRFRNDVTNAEFFLESTDWAGARFQAFDETAAKSLLEAQGIVLLLDPHGVKATTLAKDLEALYNRRTVDSFSKDDRPLAVCLSKIDQIVNTPEEFERALREPEAFVRNRLDPVLIRTINQYHTRVKYFPVSAAGMSLRYGTVQKAVFYDDRMAMRVTENVPVNIFEPFLWIFDELQEGA